MFFKHIFYVYLHKHPPNIMSYKNQFIVYKKHLLERYSSLVEKSNDYMFEDEAKSDLAAFKAMKLLKKINQIYYLEREFTI